MSKRNIILSVIVLAFVVFGAGLLITLLAPPTSGVRVRDCVGGADGCLTLPQITATTIDNAPVTYPDDFTAELTLIVMPFDRDQQVTAADWLPEFQALAGQYPQQVAYASIAILPDMAPALRTLVQVGLSAAIRDPAVRSVVSVAYLEDQTGFINALNIPDNTTLRLFIISDDGVIVWQGAGAYDTATADALRTALTDAVNR